MPAAVGKANATPAIAGMKTSTSLPDATASPSLAATTSACSCRRVSASARFTEICRPGRS